MISDVYLDHSTYAEPPSRLVSLFTSLPNSHACIKCMCLSWYLGDSIYVQDPTCNFTKTNNSLVHSLSFPSKWRCLVKSICQVGNTFRNMREYAYEAHGKEQGSAWRLVFQKN